MDNSSSESLASPSDPEDVEEEGRDQKTNVDDTLAQDVQDSPLMKGKGKSHVRKTNGHKMLPPEILETILYLTDPQSFASLILVDHTWRSAAQTPHLYAHHLSRCPSYSINNLVADAGPFTDDSLPELKRKFAQEVKRNLFEAYLQPRRTFVSLVSTSTSSSAAFPGGEAFDFSFSPNGHWGLALSSARIYVLDTVSPKISVQRELKVLRRPVSAAILDDGSTLAVLSSDHHVNVYNLANLKTKHLRSISLDNPPHAIALTPKGEVLAAAFDGGVELHSLAPDASESSWRTVKCDRLDSLTFSSDGTMLLGTTRGSKDPNTVILTAPYYAEDNQDLPIHDQISHIWTSQIIFPNSSRDCSHATLLPNRSDGDANWAFTYDKVFESFRAVRTDDLRNGTTYFPGPKPPRREIPRGPRKKLTPCTLPASSYCGDLVAAGFQGKDIWLYGVPEGLDIATVSQSGDPHSSSTSGSSPQSVTTRSPARSYTRNEATELTRLPSWQVLVDKYRNVFAKGRKIAEIPGATGVCWVSRKHEKGRRSLAERLIIAAPGGISSDSGLDGDEFASVDGGRLLILDFDRTIENGRSEKVTFEVGNAIPEMLEEDTVDIDTEVALARRRTVRKDGAAGANALANAPEMPPVPPLPPTANASTNGNTSSLPDSDTQIQNNLTDQSLPTNDPTAEALSLEEVSQFFDGPYSPTSPRSRNSLYRSATAIAANRQRNPPAPRSVDDGRIVYRRPGDRTELPHESDADNWVPPPPPYAPNPDIPLPDELRRSIMPRATEPIMRPRSKWERPMRASTMFENANSRRVSSLPERPRIPSTQEDTETPRPGHRSIRSASESIGQDATPVSPMSSPGPFFRDDTSDTAQMSRTASPASPEGRPVTSYITRLTGSLKRPSSSRASNPVPPMPSMPSQFRQSSQSHPSPPSPTRNLRPDSVLTLTGTNLQRRLEYPLPPAPSDTATPPNDDLETAIAASMPSAEQVANLNNRYRQAPSPQTSRQLPPGLITSGDRIPAPPRGALGAAGSPSSQTPNGPSHTPTRSLSGSRNPLAARSSPALLRPSAKRLDTIESISSAVSPTRTRSQTRAASVDLHTAERISYRRSHSLGPALRLDATGNGGVSTRRSFFGGRKLRREKGRGRDREAEFYKEKWEAEEGGGREKGGRCVLM